MSMRQATESLTMAAKVRERDQSTLLQLQKEMTNLSSVVTNLTLQIDSLRTWVSFILLVFSKIKQKESIFFFLSERFILTMVFLHNLIVWLGRRSSHYCPGRWNHRRRNLSGRLLQTNQTSDRRRRRPQSRSCVGLVEERQSPDCRSC